MNKNRKNFFYIILLLLGAFLIIHYWKSLESFILKFLGAAAPVIIGFAMAYLINIVMDTYEKKLFPHPEKSRLSVKIKRPLCLVLSIATVFTIITLVFVLVIPELVSCIKLLISALPGVRDKLLESEFISKNVSDAIISAIPEINLEKSAGKIASFLFSGIGAAAGTLYSAVTGLISFIITLFLSIVFAVYLLSGKERLTGLVKRIMNVYLPTDVSGKITNAARVFNESFRNFIVGQCTEALILGVLCSIGMFIFRFPYALMIGTVIGFTALIPIAGAFIGAGIGAIMILTVSPLKALLFIVFIIILQQLEENIIYPRVVGSKIGLPSVFVLASITVGGGLFGILGILFSVPVCSALYKLIKKDVIQRETAVK